MAKTKQVIGRVRAIDRGEFDGELAYTMFDRVTYNGELYECKQDTSAGILPTDETYWICIPATKGDTGETGDTGPVPKHKWVDGKTLFFENPDGTYDAGVDLTGDPGDKGDTGPFCHPISNSITSTSKDTAASAYAANVVYNYAKTIADRDISDSITSDSSTTYATSNAVYLMQQKIRSSSCPIGTVTFYNGAYWEPDDKSYAHPYVQVNGVYTIVKEWVFCVGITFNGIEVPDLSGLFILGASEAHAANHKYANPTTHTHTGSVGNYTLTDASLPAHTHTYPDVGTGINNFNAGSGGETVYFVNSYTSSLTTSLVGGGQAHSHSYSLDASDGLPPYIQYALIMKVA